MASAGAAVQIDRLVALWCERDRARAFLRVDHEVIDSTSSVRALVAERLLAMPASPGPHRDLYNACGVLGRMVGERGGSPTLVAAMIDGLLESLAETSGSLADSSWVAPARAALAEGYAAARLEAAGAEMRVRWEYPMCAVPLHEGIIAIAAGYPDDDEDALHAWASRVAHAAALEGVRRVVIAGSGAAQAAIEEALNVAGIERIPSYRPPMPRSRMAWKG